MVPRDFPVTANCRQQPAHSASGVGIHVSTPCTLPALSSASQEKPLNAQGSPKHHPGTAAGGTGTSEALQGLSTEHPRGSKSTGLKADGCLGLFANVHHTVRDSPDP